MIEEAGQNIPEYTHGLLEFTDFAVAFRYEAFPDLEADIDRRDCIDGVGRLLQHVERFLKRIETR